MKRFPKRSHAARIKVIGIGDGGTNAVNRMINAGVRGVDFVTANTSTSALNRSEAPTRIQLGNEGLGTGSNVDYARVSAESSEHAIRNALAGADMVFVTAGLGKGTGTGAAPVIARIAREMGALTIGVVTLPFSIEGTSRMETAHAGLKNLTQYADTMITIPNDRLLKPELAMGALSESFSHVDDILSQAVRSISNVVNVTGFINVDYADVRTVMCKGGNSIMSIGEASGDKAACQATLAAVNSNALGLTIDGAQGIIFNVTASSSLGALDLNEAASIVRDKADADVELIFGVVEDPRMGDEVRVTLIATGFEFALEPVRKRQSSPFMNANNQMIKHSRYAPKPVIEEPVMAMAGSVVEAAAEVPVYEHAAAPSTSAYAPVPVIESERFNHNPAEVIDSVMAKVTQEESVPTRRVFLSPPNGRRRANVENDDSGDKFLSNKWGLPSFMQG